MFRKTFRIAPLALGALALALFPPVVSAADEPSAYHRYLMKGSIIEKKGPALYLCIGTNDGAEVGQELDVVRVQRAPGGGGKSGIVRFERKQVGRLRIEEIVDEHFARAHLLSGEGKKGDLVELRAADH